MGEVEREAVVLVDPLPSDLPSSPSSTERKERGRLGGLGREIRGGVRGKGWREERVEVCVPLTTMTGVRCEAWMLVGEGRPDRRLPDMRLLTSSSTKEPPPLDESDPNTRTRTQVRRERWTGNWGIG